MRCSKTKNVVFILFMLIVASGFKLYASGNVEVPEIPPVTSGTQYISPNGDGVQDLATLDFSVKIYVKSKEGYVPEYGIKISDSSGNVVSEITKKEESDLFWLLWIFKGYEQFTLDKEITWDGTDQDGNLLSDGVYGVSVWGEDGTEQITEVKVDDFVIDTKKPKLKIKAPESLAFSPNNDGIGDVFILLQSDGSIEKKWKAAFKDGNGNIVKNYIWEDSAPEDIFWDGTNDDGLSVKDGLYSYEISSTDQAGNKSEEYKIEGIEVNGMSPEFSLEMESPAFSPNDDGVKDQLIITPIYQQPEKIVKWSWSIANSSSVLLNRSGDSSEELPSTVVFDGHNDSGFPFYPGKYLFSMSVEYENSWRSVAEQDIVIDIASPRVEVAADKYSFSPNGDGLGDSVSITFKSNEAVTWEGKIIDMTGELVLDTDYTKVSSKIIWDGTNSKHVDVPDGEYLVLGVFSDLAGNVTYAEPFTLKIDRRPVDTEIIVPSGFSPNGDGFEDTLNVKINSELYEDVKTWTFNIIDDTGEILKSFSGKDTLPKELSWDGVVTQQGNVAPALDGVYQAILYVDYEKGDFVKTQSDFFAIDKKAPEINLVVKSNPFTQTDEGLEGEVFISVNVEEDRAVRGWMLDIFDEEGKNVRTFAGEGNPSGNITWNTADGENSLADGHNYTIKLRVTDEAGNSSELKEVIPLDVMLVKKNGKYFLTVPNVIFGAYKYALDSAGPAQEKANYQSLKHIVTLADRYPSYNLELEAHALDIYLGSDRQDEEESVLGPLTENRAKEVKKALVEMGMAPERITIESFGGLQPMVSITDRSIRWKNRRVEFAVTGLE
ncbi:MAG: hypothetical protein PQJ46_16820 [Spirochaetales bacterium]|nr:hypothetical protein [Spirochaetales bacterium]